MTVELNRQEIELTADTTNLLQLLEKENLAGAGVAVAIDGKLASRAEWGSTLLAEGMKITVIRAVCGG